MIRIAPTGRSATTEVLMGEPSVDHRGDVLGEVWCHSRRRPRSARAPVGRRRCHKSESSPGSRQEADDGGGRDLSLQDRKDADRHRDVVHERGRRHCHPPRTEVRSQQGRMKMTATELRRHRGAPRGDRRGGLNRGRINAVGARSVTHLCRRRRIQRRGLDAYEDFRSASEGTGRCRPQCAMQKDSLWSLT